MKEDLTLAHSFTLAENHALWVKARRAGKAHEKPRKKSAVAKKKKEDGKQYNNKSRQGAKCRDRSPIKGGLTPKNYSKFSIPIHQIFRNIKSEPWFKLPKQSKGDTSKMDHTKYCVFHRSPGHTIDDYYTENNYLEKLMKEGKVDRYLDKPAAQPRRNADADE
ncbi:hypothetical protein ACFX2F_046997 [Malus domestica]